MTNLKYSKEEVHKLFYLVARDKLSVTEAAKETGINRSTATAILEGRGSYSNFIPDDLSDEEEYRLKNLRRFHYESRGLLTEEQVRTIYHEFTETDIKISQLAREYNVSTRVIDSTLQGNSYRNVFDSLSKEEVGRLYDALQLKTGERPDVTAKRLENSQRDYQILLQVLSTTTSYRKIAANFELDPTYITHLIKGKRGQLSLKKLLPHEKALLQKLSKDSKCREDVVNAYLTSKG